MNIPKITIDLNDSSNIKIKLEGFDQYYELQKHPILSGSILLACPSSISKSPIGNLPSEPRQCLQTAIDKILEALITTHKTETEN